MEWKGWKESHLGDSNSWTIGYRPMAIAAMRKWQVGGQGKEGSRKPQPPGWDDHLGDRKPLFGEAALSAFSTRMASSTKSKS